jgi:hypothetical protein
MKVESEEDEDRLDPPDITPRSLAEPTSDERDRCRRHSHCTPENRRVGVESAYHTGGRVGFKSCREV